MTSIIAEYKNFEMTYYVHSTLPSISNLLIFVKIRVFNRKDVLQRHIKTVHTIRKGMHGNQYQKDFSTSYGVTRHIKKYTVAWRTLKNKN
ncbi:unnamed protein product [Aphis gossypii]|uniref:Uncharacterized protein n=1 Tax=Aphis gossypii TaxID=80765 RepID=A0A9P0J9Q6_APHGO|nr:unnamed protein product [Aphis gossypii]